MKTFKHLYPQIASFENLLLAFYKARRGKRSRPDVASFEFDLETNLLKLQNSLQTETYCPGRYHNFNITDPKPRLHLHRAGAQRKCRCFRRSLPRPGCASCFMQPDRAAFGAWVHL